MIKLSRILIIDDNFQQLRILVDLLRKTEFTISVAFSGTEGYRRAIAQTPDIILLDVNLGDLLGTTVCRMLKANPITAKIPILFLSVASTPAEKVEGLKAGAVDYIGKPFEAEEVLERLRVHLRVRRSMEQDTQQDPSFDTSPPIEQKQSTIIPAIEQYIADHLRHVSTADELANTFKLSARQLNHLFISENGRSVFEHIRLKRFEVACKLLNTTRLSVAEISEEVGFGSAANFATAFKKHLGMTPREYRTKA